MKGTKIGMVFVIAAMTASTFAVAPAFATECGHNELETLVVRFTTDADSYRRGEVVRMKVSVERRIAEHSLGPAVGVELTGALTAAHTAIGGGAVTDETGSGTVRVRIPRHMPLGYADAFMYAQKEIVNLPCLRRTEYGHQSANDLVRITR